MASAKEIVSATSKHTASVIFLHGLGDTGHGWSQMFQTIRQPYIRYVCPTARIIPVTLNMGMRMPSWFDIKGLKPGDEEDEAGIKAADRLLQGLIAEEEKLGVPRNRILIGGFSQGGALALYTAFTSPADKTLAGVVALSTWIPLAKSFPGAVKGNQNTPVLQCHGDADMLLPLPVGQATTALIKSFNNNVQFKVYKGMNHSSDDQEIQDVKKFITTCLPPV